MFVYSLLKRNGSIDSSDRLNCFNRGNIRDLISSVGRLGSVTEHRCPKLPICLFKRDVNSFLSHTCATGCPSAVSNAV